MGVYTVLDAAEVEAFLHPYDVGELRALEPVGPGIENTTYAVETLREGRPARFVLTLFERAKPERVAEVAALTVELEARGVPCAVPLRAGDTGRPVGRLRGKPAVLVPFVEGRAVERPAAADLEALGRAAARLHRVAADLPFSRPGPHLAEVLCPLARDVAEKVRPDEPALAELLLREADAQEAVPQAELPQALLHGDLFLDNALFGDPESRREECTLLDFHLAGRGPCLYDVAVALLDGAWVGRGLSGDATRAFLGAYRSERPLGPEEFSHLLAYLRRAALRFLCLRIRRFLLDDSHLAAGRGKDPWELARRLKILRDEG